MVQIPEGYTSLEGSERRVIPGAQRIGPADAGQKISLSIVLRERTGAPPLPGHEDWMTAPPARRKYLSREQLGSLHGAARQDADQVAAFARAHGFEVTEVSLPRRTVFVSCTVEQASRAFAVELDVYELEMPELAALPLERRRQRYRSHTGPVSVPSQLAGVISGVFGLDNRQVAQRLYSGRPPGVVTPLSPREVAALYNFPLDPAKSNARGETVAVLEFNQYFFIYEITAGFQQSDLNSYISNLVGAYFSAPNVVTVSIDNEPIKMEGPFSGIPDPSVETALDIEVIAAVAQGANIVAYFAPDTEQGWIDAITHICNDTANDPSVLSISYGGLEDIQTPCFMTNMSSWFQAAAALGMTVTVSSGDTGSNCNAADNLAHVEYPASDPWVTACGGTTITDVQVPLGMTFTEIVWNDLEGATGGGISSFFPQPPWQIGANLPMNVNPVKFQGRGLPDIAGNASPFSGYPIWVYGKQTTSPVGGTSAVAPLYAALAAIVNSKLGYRTGYWNPALYAFGVTGQYSVFNDITQGWNNEYLSTLSLYYSVGPGWDGCTGWGSVRGGNFLQALAAGTSINLTDTTPLSPAACVYMNELWVFWKANDPSNAIYFSASSNGQVWPAGQKINTSDSTPQPLAACVFNNQIYLLWTANDPSNQIYYSGSPGPPWPGGQLIDSTDTTPLALNAMSNTQTEMLQIFWRANDASNDIYSTAQGYITPLDFPAGTMVGVEVTRGRGNTSLIAYSTPFTPAACMFQGSPYLFWTANDASGSIQFAELGSEFVGYAAAAAISSAAATTGPAVCVFNMANGPVLYLFWTSTNSIYFSASVDAANWNPPALLNPHLRTSQAPAACVFNNMLYVFWTDDLGSRNIYYSYSPDGVNWS